MGRVSTVSPLTVFHSSTVSPHTFMWTVQMIEEEHLEFLLSKQELTGLFLITKEVYKKDFKNCFCTCGLLSAQKQSST